MKPSVILAIAVLVVGLIVSIAVAVSIDSDRDKAEQDRDRLKKQKDTLDEKVAKLYGEIDELREIITGKREEVDTIKIQKTYLDEGSKVIPELLKEEKLLKDDPFTKAMEEEGIREGKKYSNLIALQSDLIKELKGVINVLPRLRAAREGTLEDLRGVQEEKKEIESRLKKEIDSLRSKLTEEQDRALEREREFDREKKRLEDEIGSVKKLIVKNEREFNIREAQLLTKINELQDKIKDLSEKKRKTKEEIEADGEITYADSNLGLGWINLGKRDGIRRGLRFEVFQFRKGGEKKLKGVVEVRDIEANMSQVSIISDVKIRDPKTGEVRVYPDPSDPIIKGDLIRNPMFDKREQQIFVFLGEKPINRIYSKKDLERKIEDTGAKVGKSITIETDFVVLLEKGDEQPEFEKAIQFGIIILKENELLEYLGP